MSAPLRLLVATDNASDAEVVEELLREEFEGLVLSTDPDRAIEDFDAAAPNVLILGFNTLEKAERYYLGLYRLSSTVHTLPHRTIVLCNKDDLRRVYELCRRGYFFDYVLFWPIGHDACRLHMAIHHAMRDLSAAAPSVPDPADFRNQLHRIAELESLLAQHTKEGGQRLDAADRSLHRAQEAIGIAVDELSSSLSAGVRTDLIEVKDSTALRQEFEQLKSAKIEKSLRTVADSVRPVRAWADSLEQSIGPQLESVRSLKELSDRVRPTVLVVDDDEFQHGLLRRALSDRPLDLVFCTSCAQAFSLLQKRRPDLILMDLQLPDINGVDATQRIKSIEAFERIPVIMLTGTSDKQTVIQSRKAGASDFLVKPFNKAVLVEKITKFLGESGAPPPHRSVPP